MVNPFYRRSPPIPSSIGSPKAKKDARSKKQPNQLLKGISSTDYPSDTEEEKRNKKRSSGIRKLWQRSEEEDGYESDASTGSARSTTSKLGRLDAATNGRKLRILRKFRGNKSGGGGVDGVDWSKDESEVSESAESFRKSMMRRDIFYRRHNRATTKKKNSKGNGARDVAESAPAAEKGGVSTKGRFKMSSMMISSSAGSPTSETPPPSPMFSDVDDNGMMPLSLPPEVVGLRYSLRSAIGDGAARQPSGPSVMDRRDLRPNGCHIDTSHWSHMGMRSYMEDRYAIEELGALTVVSPATNGSDRTNGLYSRGVHTSLRKRGSTQTIPLSWFGIFDGHGGELASQFCSDWMSSYVRNHKRFPHDLGSAMKVSFNTADQDFVGTGNRDGTTACACIVVGSQKVICSNAGDSRAIVVRRDGSIARLSRDHKPGVPDETRRITDLGGRVVYWGRWRVEGLLAVSRSIGDAALKPYVSSDPEICEYELGQDDLFLVMASDGIWDVLENEQVAQFVLVHTCCVDNGCLAVEPGRLRWIARKLCERAKERGSTDNFSCIIASLQSYENESNM